MKRKNEKGFALVLSLLLLLVMSLMGGSLIVISSTDHQIGREGVDFRHPRWGQAPDTRTTVTHAMV